MSDKAETKKAPDYNVFVKVPVGVETRIGSQIGVAFKHNDGNGMNLILDAQPIPLEGKIELVAFAAGKKE